MTSTVLVWTIVAGTIAGILMRPRGWPEAVWACIGAAVLVLFRLLSPLDAWKAIGKGTDVYLFLAGMMLLAELARREGVFDWLAGLACRAARGSPRRLFTLVYGVGILVTVFLSNDATAVVLTPAVYARCQECQDDRASLSSELRFYRKCGKFRSAHFKSREPGGLWKAASAPLPWLKLFLLPSLLSITATFLVLWLLSRKELKGRLDQGVEVPELSPEGRRAAWGIAVTGAVLIAASGLGLDLGLPTCVSAAATVLISTRVNRKALTAVTRDVSWSVLPLVAGLFVLVEALDGAGALRDIGTALTACATLRPFAGSLATSFGVAALGNIMNNLPSTACAHGDGLANPARARLHAARRAHRDRSGSEPVRDGLACNCAVADLPAARGGARQRLDVLKSRSACDAAGIAPRNDGARLYRAVTVLSL